VAWEDEYRISNLMLSVCLLNLYKWLVLEHETYFISQGMMVLLPVSFKSLIISVFVVV
jgi:hypothetical protein